MFRLAEAGSGAPRILSRFAYLRREDQCLVLERPGQLCRMRLLTPQAAGWLAAVLNPDVLHTSAVDIMKELLDRAGFTDPMDRTEEYDHAAWEFHDRLFHERTRVSEAELPFGATWRFRDRFPSPPALKLPMSTEVIPLPAPEHTSIRSASLLTLMEQRRSIREHSHLPMTLEQLAQFLHRSARVTEHIPSPLQEGLRRPFPSGGAVHEIEFYVAVRVCEGLSAGLYHYHGGQHALYRLPSAAPALVGALVDDGARAWGTPDLLPHMLIILSSRMPRLAWKAESTAYRTTLINAGIIQQTMCLVAADMGLAGCPLGYGNSRTFAAATGLDDYCETSVSEFALGAA